MAVKVPDLVATVAIGAYLIGVGRAGNGRRLLELAEEDAPGLIRWALAGALLVWIVRQLPDPWDGVGQGVLLLGVASQVLNAGPEMLKQIAGLFAGRGQNS